MTFHWDLFISHAREDKDEFVVPLVAALEQRKLSSWFDECELAVGDSLRAKIDEGLSRSRFGVVVLSPFFFAKDWPRIELDALLSRERYGFKVILPIWHKVSRDEILAFSPILASRLGLDSQLGPDGVAERLHRAVERSGSSAPHAPVGESDAPRPMDLSTDDDDLSRFYRK